MTIEPAQNITWWKGLRSVSLGVLLLLCVLAILPAFHSFGYQLFSMPSGSMKPTLLIGDYVVATKHAYGFSRYSFPGSPPLFAGRIFAAQPSYGDVIVFRLPSDPSTDYVKRVVGLPGDRIQMIHGVLNINGAAVKQEDIEDFVETDGSGRTTRVKQWRETLPNGASYATLDIYPDGFWDNTNVYVVPAAHLFVLGDNRDNSQDSRTSHVGYIPLENLVGRVDRIVFSIDRESRSKSVRFERIGMVVH